MDEKKKYIAKLQKITSHLRTEYKITRVLGINGNVAFIGNIAGFEQTDKKINSIYKKLYSITRKEARQIHYYIERETWNDLRKDPRVSALLAHLGIVIHIIDNWDEFKIEENMKFSGMVINPPFEFGNKINAEVIKHLTDDGRAVIIQPLNQYKGQKLYEHIGQFELADPKLFSDAVITENLNISIVTKKKQNRFTWQQLVLESCDQNFRKFYDWNIEHNKDIAMLTVAYKPLSYFNPVTDFIETSRSFSESSGSGFGENGLGYKWNVLNDYTKVNAENGVIRLNNQRQVKNLAKFWYNGKKWQSLCSKLILGVHAVHASSEYFFAIPQIDWETIDQHPLWNTDVDAAVLDTMGLKWNNDKTKIV